jgi:hypothetical protein
MSSEPRNVLGTSVNTARIAVVILTKKFKAESSKPDIGEERLTQPLRTGVIPVRLLVAPLALLHERSIAEIGFTVNHPVARVE